MDILSAAIDAARSFAGDVYVIGGPVRDALLGREARDLDFTVSDRAVQFANELARRTGGRVAPESRFLTTKVVAGGEEIDVTTIRREIYPRPGALPEVAPGTLQDDLFRRDFAANAIALDLRSGELLDPLGGRDDIAKRQLRLLHDRSFVDDPTRIFRAIRLRRRLAFSIEPHTDRLVQAAIDDRALQTISADRYWREVVLALEEEAPGALIAELSARGALRRITPETGEGVAQRLSSLDHLLTGELREIDRGFVYLATLLNGQPSEHLEEFPLQRRTVDRFASVVRRVDEALAALDSAPDPLTIDAGLEELVLASLIESRHADAVRLIAAFRRFATPVSGRDLGVPPGPHIARALFDVRRALFRSEISPAEALAFAQRRALQYLERGETQPETGGETGNR